MSLDKALSWFINGWLALVVFLNALNVVGTLMLAPSLVEGVARTREAYSPFDLSNLVVEVIVLSPVIAAIAWRGRRRAAREDSRLADAPKSAK